MKIKTVSIVSYCRIKNENVLFVNDNYDSIAQFNWRIFLYPVITQLHNLFILDVKVSILKFCKMYKDMFERELLHFRGKYK